MSADESPARGRGRSRGTIALVDAAARILAEIRPASIRAVCYRLFTEGLIDSMARRNTNRVSHLLAREREAGNLPWEWVTDETRTAERPATWRDLAEFGDVVKGAYRRDHWAMQPRRVEVWSEKGTVRGTLAPVLAKYGLTFRVMHGYGSATAVHEAAVESIGDKPLVALYAGDWDPSGAHMSMVDLPERLARYGGSVELVRVAVDPIADKDAPSFHAHQKAGDRRYSWFMENFGDQCIEVDAVSPPSLRSRVEAGVLAYLDRDAWEHAVKIEFAERESVRGVMERWPSISGLAPSGGAA